jgi:hypothetical protein
VRASAQSKCAFASMFITLRRLEGNHERQSTLYIATLAYDNGASGWQPIGCGLEYACETQYLGGRRRRYRRTGPNTGHGSRCWPEARNHALARARNTTGAENKANRAPHMRRGNGLCTQGAVERFSAPSEVGEKIVANDDANAIRLTWQLNNALWLFLVTNDKAQSAPRLRWWWRAIGKNGVTREADDRFASLDDCQADAATHGFDAARG